MPIPASRVPLYPLEQSASPAVVAVTGASGYVAGELVRRLLAGGHTVHATVRNPAATAKVAHLLALPGAPERLKLFKADLNAAGSFDAAVAGCRYVFHTASPFITKVAKGKVEEELVGPAVAGVDNVLSAVSKAGGVQAVVLTSSVAAVFGDNWERGPDHVFTEADWDESASATYLPYSYSKTLAERRAWELHAAQAGGAAPWRLATVLPGFVLGPPLGEWPSSVCARRPAL